MIPLTFAQERLWLFDQIETADGESGQSGQTASAAYNLPFGLRLRGGLDVPALRRTLDEIVARHEILRTTFPAADGRPYQLIAGPAPVPLPVLDLSGHPAGERERRLEAETAADAGRPFDLANGPLLRARLVRLAGDEHVLFLVTHHIVSDGWSNDRLMAEVEALYPAFARGQPPPLAELPVQYADFALWQREVLRGEALDTQVGYWRRVLDGVPPLELPTDRPRPREQTFHGGSHWFPVPEPVGAEFLALARGAGATPYMALLAAFQLLLARHTGQHDIAVGTPIAGRARPELYDLIGFFVNTLVLRGDLSGDPSFRELLARTRATVLAAFAHQDVPLQLVASQLRFTRDLSRNALFQVVFAYQDVPAREPALPGLEVSSYAPEVAVNLADLQLNVYPNGDGLLGHLIYNRDLFDAGWVQRLGEQLVAVLQRAAADPDAPGSELSVLPVAQRRRMVTEWNATGVDFGGPSTVAQLFAAQVARSPAAEAVSGGDARLSYRELSAAANRVANRLRRRGVGPGSVVGVCAPRGAGLVVALLGVVKAGAAYLPLDPGYPAGRVRFMVADAGVSVVLVGGGGSGPSWGQDVAVVGLDEADRESDEDPPVVARPGDAAYVIYTSGSTGAPKGVLVGHAALADRVHWMSGTYQLGPGDRVLQFAPVSFDTHAEEIYPCLTSGATLVVPDPELSLPEILPAPAGAGLTVLDLPTPYWHELVRMVRAGQLTFPESLRLTIIGADQAHADAVAAWHELVGSRLVNTYGPTEATIVATAAELSAADRDRTVPIGRPIANTQAYVLDAGLNPVPVGVVGEIYLGGVGLAYGYLGRPGLTAQQFVPDPFGQAPGGRLYRTGDLGRFRADGALEFAGRADDQVKVRGFRIELGEVEAALVGHPAVGQAALVARDEGRRGRRLVAYVVPADGVVPGTGQLREFVAELLPEYMVPSAFVVLAGLPLTPNGKVDRRALPAPDAPAGTGFREPSTVAERVLAQVWQELLGVARVGLDDNFFELGGDSIISIQVVARARTRGVEITPRQMFRHQRLGELASVAGTRTAAPVGAGPATGTVPFTPIQRWFLDRELGNRSHVNQSVLLSVPAQTDPALVERALAAVVAHHDALRLRLRPVPAGGWEQYLADPATDPVPVAGIDLTPVAPAQRPARLTAHATDLQAGLDLERGPLLRCALFTLAPGEAKRLFLTIHHFATDAVSWQILLDDIAHAYDRLGRGEEAGLGPRTTSVKAYGEWLQRYADTPRLHTELPYWRRVLSGEDCHLPVDHHQGDNSIESVDTVTVGLTPDETEALLRDLPRTHRAQVVDAVLAALAGAVSGWTGRRSLLVDLEGHGREELDEGIDLTRTVGWFTSLFPLRITSDGDYGTPALLGRVSHLRREIPHHGVGYGVLRHLSAEGARALAGLPVPPISVNYLGRFDQAAESSALFGPADEDGGPDLAATGPRAYLLELNGGVFRGRLEMTFAYSRNRHSRETVERLADGFLTRLRELVPAGPERYPLSPLQHGLLFHTLQRPDQSVYIVQMELLLHGELDADAFRRAWQLLAQRHPILRSAVRWEGLDQPVQEVHPGVELPYTVLDWRHLDTAEQPRRREEFLAGDRSTGFDLGAAPLARVTLIRHAPATTRLVATFHHLLLDGWSSARLLEELFAGYAAFRSGWTPRLAPVRPYRDYIAWLAERDAAADEAFWRRRLAGFTWPTPIGVRPAAARPEPEPEPESVDHLIELGAAPTARLTEFARRHRTTLSTLLYGAWALVIGRNTGENEVVFGVTLAGRPYQLPGFESMIGLFINTLPLRVRLRPPDPDQSVSRWLRGLQEDVTELQEHEYTALVDVHGWSDVPRGTQLFDSIVVFENYPTAGGAGADEAGLRVEQVQVREQTSYPLTIAATAGERLLLRLSYQPSRFEAGWVERAAEQLLAVLEHMAADPDRPLAAVPVLPAAHRRTVVEEWNDTDADYGPAATLGELFTAQVRRTPDAIAVRCGDRRLTYAELATAAHRVAHRLRASGAGPDSVVGVCGERSLELVAGLLGVLQAGAAYLPLDPAYPAQRLSFMLADSGARVLLDFAGTPFPRPPDVVTLGWDELGGGPDDDPGPGAGPDHLAYVIYTSGSTGRPKAVMTTHAAICNRLRWMQDAYRLDRTDRVLQKTPSSFDVSVWEFFWPLLTGARLVLARPDGHRDPAYLRDLIAAERITTVHFVPSMLQVFLEQEQLERCGSLRRVICSGEELPAPLAGRFFARFDTANPSVELHNLYGPTEAAVDVTSWRCDGGAATDPIPIGRPIANTRVYLLDDGLNPVPAGVPGEVYLGGAGLARGYLGRPGLTAQRFVPDPFGAPGGRLYRTGDLGRYRPDGAIEFLGRTDHQVKLRGFRIELGEIEAALAAHPRVARAVVVARDEPATGRRLVAYLVPTGEPPTVDELRDQVGRSLPEYMVPAAFLMLPSLPLTPSGKVDRKALPAPDPPAPAPQRYREPTSPVERMLAQVWQELLGADRVGLDDDFFALGGHSLLAMRVVANASKLLPAGAGPIRVMDIFAHPTVGGLATLVESGPSGAGPVRLLHELTPRIAPPQRKASFVCVPYGGGSAVVFQPLADALPAGYSLYAVGLPGHDPGLPDEEPGSIDELARRCADELAAIDGPLILYGHCLGGGALAVALAQQLEACGRELTAVYIGGSFPSTRLPGRLSRAVGRVLKTGSLVGDRTYYHLFKAMGGFRGVLGEEELAQIMRMLRHDVREAEEFYAHAYAAPPQVRLRAPIVSVVAERDPTTELHQERYLEWLHFGESVALVVLPGSDHYFLNSQADQLAAIATTVHADDEDPPPVPAKIVRPPPAGRPDAAVVEPSRLASLRVFGLVASSQLVSMVGSGLTGFALGLWVYLATGSLTRFALVEMFAILPGVLLAPVAGAIVDRTSRRTVMLIANLVGAATLLVMAALVGQDLLELWLIFVLLSVLSVAGGFHGIAYLSAIPQLAPKRYLIRMNGLVQVSIGVAEMVAPLLAVGLLAWIGIGAVLLVDAATFAVGAAVLAVVAFPRTLPLQRLESLRDEIVYGFRYLIRTPGLRLLLTYFCVLSVLTAPLFLLVVPLVLPFGSIGAIGWLFLGAGLGVMLGGLLMTMWGGPRRLMAGVLGSSITGGLAVISIGLYPSLATVGFGLFAWVLSAAVFQACYASIVQLKVPLALQGRVFAVVQMVSLGVAPIAFMATGPLGDHVFEPLLAADGALAGTVGQVIGVGEGRGIAFMYLVAGAGILLATLLAYRSRALWRLEDDLADALPDEPVPGRAGVPPPPSRYFDETAVPAPRRRDEHGTTGTGPAGGAG